MVQPIVVAVDQGTSSTKAVAVDGDGRILAQASVPISQAHPNPGWVEQDAEEIADSAVKSLRELSGQLDGPISAIGLSTQRESAVVWERSTGVPVGPMLGWQDRRTAERALALAGEAERIRQVTGLPLDPMFSALKLSWLLDQVDPDRTRSAAGDLAVGTVDSWLVARLTGEHRIELGNASRTQLLDVQRGVWDSELLDLFGIPATALPRLAASDEPTAPVRADGVAAVPITGILGDSHAALYGHGIREPGAVKVTLGTGSSVMGLGEVSPGALARTIAWATPTRTLGFEGNILSAGSTLVWLAGVLGVDTGALVELGLDAAESPVELVPAFSGLGAPWWDKEARAVITGFDLATDRAALARAGVESIAMQVEDVLAVADAATGTRIDTIHVDGGPAANDRMVQRLADLTGRAIVRPAAAGLSALGAASLAGTAAGVWASLPVGRTHTFSPTLPPDAAAARRTRWQTAIALARHRAATSSKEIS